MIEGEIRKGDRVRWDLLGVPCMVTGLRPVVDGSEWVELVALNGGVGSCLVSEEDFREYCSRMEDPP